MQSEVSVGKSWRPSLVESGAVDLRHTSRDFLLAQSARAVHRSVDLLQTSLGWVVEQRPEPLGIDAAV